MNSLPSTPFAGGLSPGPSNRTPQAIGHLMTTSPHSLLMLRRGHDITRSFKKGVVAACLIACAGQGMANNVGENSAWQFQTSADKANQAAIQDMIQRRKAGSYGAASTTNNTYIQRQFNCDVNATAQGNQGSNSTVANSPSTSGAAATSTGNDNTGWSGSGTVTTGQANAGTVGSQVNGSTTTGVQGWAAQALNSNQTSSGSQSASVSGSTACAYGTLN